MPRTKTNSRRVAFKVTLQLPAGATVADALDYIKNAVGSWHGSLKPPCRDPEDMDGDPMFSLDGDTVEVRRLYPRKRKP